MRAITIEPRRPGSLRLEEVEDARMDSGPLAVRTLAVGVCGTDRELIGGEYGDAPPGRPRLVLGHESLGRVIRAPRQGELQTGDLVVGIVRYPDPVPCANRRHYQEAAAALERADRGWLERLITREVPLARWREAYEKQPHDVKTVLAFED
jgi:threonine dehydrogenase-like Zn-dependent dehydrogenase